MVAIGDYDERYVIPKRHGEVSTAAFAEQGSCGIDFVNGAAAPGLAEQTGERQRRSTTYDGADRGRPRTSTSATCSAVQPATAAPGRCLSRSIR